MSLSPSDDHGPNCPACGYGQPWAVIIQGEYDGAIIWECPACRHAWPRFTGGRWNRRAAEIIADWKGGVGQ